VWDPSNRPLETGVLVSEKVVRLFMGARITGAKFYRCGIECYLEWENSGDSPNPEEMIPEGTHLMLVETDRVPMRRDSSIIQNWGEKRRFPLEDFVYCELCKRLIRKVSGDDDAVESWNALTDYPGEMAIETAYFYQADWYGSDFFPMDQYIVVSEKVVDLLRENGISNWYAKEVYPVEGKPDEEDLVFTGL